MSFSDISKIKRKVTGEGNEDVNKEKPISIASQAFTLFLDKKIFGGSGYISRHNNI